MWPSPVNNSYPGPVWSLVTPWAHLSVWCLTITGERNSCSSKVPNMGRTNLWEELNCCIMLPEQQIPTPNYSISFNRPRIPWGTSSERNFWMFIVIHWCSMQHSLQQLSQEMSDIPLRVLITAWGNILRVPAAMRVSCCHQSVLTMVHVTPYSGTRDGNSLFDRRECR